MIFYMLRVPGVTGYLAQTTLPSSFTNAFSPRPPSNTSFSGALRFALVSTLRRSPRQKNRIKTTKADLGMEEQAYEKADRGRNGRGRGGKGGGRMGREVQVSKALSRLLRHQAANAGIKLDEAGFAELDKVVSLPSPVSAHGEMLIVHSWLGSLSAASTSPSRTSRPP